MLLPFCLYNFFMKDLNFNHSCIDECIFRHKFIIMWCDHTSKRDRKKFSIILLV